MIDVLYRLRGPQARDVPRQRSVYTVIAHLPIEADGRVRHPIKSKRCGDLMPTMRLRAFPHVDHDSRPTAQIFVDTSHGRESQQHLAATSSGLGRRNRLFCGNSAGTEPTF